MTMQEDFVLTLESQIRQCQNKIDDLEKKFGDATQDARVELRRRIEECRHVQLDARRKLQEYHERAKGPYQDTEAQGHAEDILQGVFGKTR
ncbi:MAG: sll1863 family stress response protein [Candidatus Latescibacterota bacterium]